MIFCDKLNRAIKLQNFTLDRERVKLVQLFPCFLVDMEYSWIFTLLVCIQIVVLGVSGSRNIICPGTFVQDKTPISG